MASRFSVLCSGSVWRSGPVLPHIHHLSHSLVNIASENVSSMSVLWKPRTGCNSPLLSPWCHVGYLEFVARGGKWLRRSEVLAVSESNASKRHVPVCMTEDAQRACDEQQRKFSPFSRSFRPMGCLLAVWPIAEGTIGIAPASSSAARLRLQWTGSLLGTYWHEHVWFIEAALL
jgi:hypothetical protein